MRFKSTKLTAKTPKDGQTKLLDALRAVKGVDNVTLHLSTSEFEIKAKGKDEPKPIEIERAAATAGFAVAPK